MENKWMMQPVNAPELVKVEGGDRQTFGQVVGRVALKIQADLADKAKANAGIINNNNIANNCTNVCICNCGGSYGGQTYGGYQAR